MYLTQHQNLNVKDLIDLDLTRQNNVTFKCIIR